MSKGDDVEVFLDSLERQLSEFEVPEANWRQILIAKLSPEANQIVQEQIADVAFTLTTSGMHY